MHPPQFAQSPDPGPIRRERPGPAGGVRRGARWPAALLLVSARASVAGGGGAQPTPYLRPLWSHPQPFPVGGGGPVGDRTPPSRCGKRLWRPEHWPLRRCPRRGHWLTCPGRRTPRGRQVALRERRTRLEDGRGRPRPLQRPRPSPGRASCQPILRSPAGFPGETFRGRAQPAGPQHALRPEVPRGVTARSGGKDAAPRCSVQCPPCQPGTKD